MSPGDLLSPSRLWICPAVANLESWKEIGNVEHYLREKFNRPQIDEEDLILEQEGDWIRTGEIVAVEVGRGG